METSYLSLLTINEILSDVTMYVDDKDQKKLTPGFYKRKVREAIDELGFTTFFDVRFEDFDTPSSLQLMLPSGAWNIRDIFAYNGDCCQVGTQTTVHYKNQFLTRGRTGTNKTGYTSRNNPQNADPLYTNIFSDENVCFYAFNNGLISLSDSCLLFEHIRIVYNGIASDINDTAIIPEMCRRGIVSYATERALYALKGKDPQKYRIQWMDSKADLIESWRDCCYRVKRLGASRRKDIAEYMSRFNY